MSLKFAGSNFTSRQSRVLLAAALANLAAASGLFAQSGMAPPRPSPAPTLPHSEPRPPIPDLPWLIATAALLLIGLLVWLFVRWLRNRPAPRPPTPREAALASLRDARNRIGQLDPYAFSILVSDILRRYVSAEFGLRATQQTSPEFLASAAMSPHFTHGEKSLLAVFLEKCDLIKFAHIDATQQDCAELLEQATRFVNRAPSEVSEKAFAPPLPLGGPAS